METNLCCPYKTWACGQSVDHNQYTWNHTLKENGLSNSEHSSIAYSFFTGNEASWTITTSLLGFLSVLSLHKSCACCTASNVCNELSASLPSVYTSCDFAPVEKLPSSRVILPACVSFHWPFVLSYSPRCIELWKVCLQNFQKQKKKILFSDETTIVSSCSKGSCVLWHLKCIFEIYVHSATVS